MGKKKETEYIQERLLFLEKVLENFLWSDESKLLNIPRIKLERLERLIKELPKKNRESIEKFWGLTGGRNYSQSTGIDLKKDIAFSNMQDAATQSLRVLLKHMLAVKVNKRGMKIDDEQTVKYIEALIVFVLNGPKLSYETDSLKIDKSLSGDAFFEADAMLKRMCADTNRLPDGSIDLKLMMDFLENLKFKYWLVIKKSMGIELPEDCKGEDIEELKNLSQIRKFKEELFPYGAWDVTSALILRDPKSEIHIEKFMKKLEVIRKDWSIERFKSGQMKLMTLSGMRTLDIYNIGGLEFTDPEEIVFLYLARNLITT